MARIVVRSPARHGARLTPASARRALVLPCAIALALLASPAAADSPRDTAKRLFADGVARFQAGDFAGARDLFAAADRAQHAPAITYNLARAEEKLGHAQEALEAYDAFVAEAGTGSELAQAAALAAADLRASTSPVRIESDPSGARVRLDGRELVQRTPTAVAVPAGEHVVEVEEGSFRASRRIVTEGRGRGLVVLLARGASDVSPAAPAAGAAAPAPAASSRPPASPESPGSRAPASAPAPAGVVLGVGFAITPYVLFPATRAGVANDSTVVAVVAGPSVDVGYAVSDVFEVLVRGYAAIGPEGKPSYAYGFGPGFSIRAHEKLWLGAGFLGGRLDTFLGGARYDTDLVFGGRAEASLAVVGTDYGQWTVFAEPSVLLTQSDRDNTCVFVPLGLGLRTY